MSEPLLSKKALALVLAFTVLLGPAVHTLPKGHDTNLMSQVAPLVAADFAISASPDSLTIPVGTTSTSSITLTSLGGFSGNIVLSASSPTLDASLNKTEVTLPGGGTAVATLSILAPSSAAPGDYTVSVGGSSGCSLSHTAQVAVTVTGPDFSISAEKGSLAISPSGSDTATIDLVSMNGFSGLVGLYSNSPGLTSMLGPDSLSLTAGGAGISTLTVSVPGGTQPGNYTVEVIGITSSLLHSIDITVTVTGAGFTLSADPFSLTVVAGASSNSSVITVIPFGGFAGSGSLTSSVDSSQLTVALSPTNFAIPGTPTSTLTLTALADTTPRLYSVTVTGSSNSLSQSVDIPVIVKGPDFELSAEPAFLSVAASGPSCTSTITVTAIKDFSGSIDLRQTSFPSGLDISLSKTTITSSETSTLTVTAPAGITPQFYYVTIEADSGPLTHFVTVGVLVTGPDFTLSPNPNFLAINAGSTGTSTITSVSLNGFGGLISLLASTPVTGITASISPSSLQGSGSATLTVDVDPSVVPDFYTVVVTGVSSPLIHTEFVSIEVTGPDFSISADSYSLTISTGSPGTSTITVGASNGFTGHVSLSAIASFNLNASIQPGSITGVGTATLSVNSTVPGSYTVIVGGSSGLLFHSLIVSVTVLGIDFSISAPASLSLPVGIMGSVLITVSSSGGFADDVTLTPSVSPTGLSCSLSSTLLAGGSGTSTLSCSGPSGTYAVTVSGTSSLAGPHSRSVTFIVADFAMSLSAVNPSQILAGSQGTTTITVTATTGFAGVVNLSVSSSTPSGLTCNLPTSVTLNSSPETASLSCSASSAGDYTVAVTGATGSPSFKTVMALFHVTDIGLTASPSNASINVGSTGTSTISVTAMNGFSGTVDLSSSMSPSAGLDCSLSRGSLILPSAIVTSSLSCTPSASGSFTVTVTGTSGPVSHSAQVTITSPPPGFSLSATPASMTIQAGGSGSSVITVTPVYGFSGEVNLTAIVSPSGPAVSLGTSSVTGGSGTSTLTVNVDSSIAAATYTVTVRGTSHSTSDSVVISVTVTSGPASSNILGLPPTTFYPLVAVVIVALVGTSLYFLRFRKKIV